MRVSNSSKALTYIWSTANASTTPPAPSGRDTLKSLTRPPQSTNVSTAGYANATRSPANSCDTSQASKSAHSHKRVKSPATPQQMSPKMPDTPDSSPFSPRNGTSSATPKNKPSPTCGKPSATKQALKVFPGFAGKA